jgi:hypothetical protein
MSKALHFATDTVIPVKAGIFNNLTSENEKYRFDFMCIYFICKLFNPKKR